ncbi:MAG: hypothetical protein JW870_20980, partial [Candidatus Delongbacteria bacterium]|nr:hypothetical protein [Candidatus Delongbacteria bacterium]
MKDFYKYKEQIDDLIKIATPTEQDLKKVLGIISDDNDLAVHFYRGNANPGWLNILNESGQFNRLADADITNDFLAKMKAFYLVKVSDNKPKEVVNLISGLNVKDWLIQGILLQSLLAKPLEVVDEGCELIQTFFKTAGHIDWYNHGERPAKFMIAIANDHPDKAFEIAELLLKIEQQDGENNYLDKTKTHFKDHDYEDLIFKHYKKLWEIYPFRATKLLIDVFNNYLNGLESDDIGLEQGFYYTIERLDQIESGYGERSVKNIIQGIYEAGKTVIEKQPERINELFGYLQSLNKPVFERIEMYLLRFVPGDGQIERVNTIIGSKKYLG